MKYIPTEANFIFIDVGVDSTAVFQRMLERGVIVQPGDIWGLPHFIRLTIGTREQNQWFIRMLRDILRLRS